MDAYLNLLARYDRAFTDPEHISSSTFDGYLIGQARALFDASLDEEKKAGRHYRGTPAQPRVRIISTDLHERPRSVILRSCPRASSTNPSIEYDSSGKPIPQPTHRIPPPYANTAKVMELSGRWLVAEFNTDGSKTCTP